MTDISLTAAWLIFPTAAVGAVAIAYYFARFLYTVPKMFRAFFLSSNVVFKSYGQWAVVTGATDGIGKAYAEQLAEKGMDVVLISRSIDKLNGVASNIERTYKVKTKVISADFSRGLEIYSDIARQLAGIDVGVLVNNVGMFSDYPEYFHLIPNKEELYAAMINCNMLSVTEMTCIVLPQMLEKKKGIIVNISSGSSVFNVPLLSVYSASKSYMTTLTKNLQLEYASQGVIIQSLTPFVVATKMATNMKGLWPPPDASSFVRSSLNTVGVLDDTFGCLSHSLEGLIVSAIPGYLRNASMFLYMQATRTAALRKSTRADKRD